MVTTEVLISILSHLSPHQIDELQLCNRRLSGIIRTNRARFRGQPVKLIHLTEDSEMDNCTIVLQSTDFSIEPPKTTKSSDICKYLYRFEPKKLSIAGNLDAGLLSALWLRKIDKIYVECFESKEKFEKFVGKLWCSTAVFKSLPTDCDGDTVLENMKHIRKLSLPSVKCSSSFFNSIVEKSKNGPGVKLLKLMNEVDNPVEATHLFDFITSGKFDNCHAVIEFVKGLKDVFKRAMLQLNEKGDRKVVIPSENVYEVVGTDCSIQLTIKTFLDSQ